jgi:hypothetical protein
MTNEEFFQELAQIVARRASAENLVDVLAFVREVAERLGEDPTFGEFAPAEFSGVGQRGKQFRLHGFTNYDDSDGSIGLVLGRWSDAEALETLLATTVAQLSSSLETFVHEAVNESLCERIIESNGAYEIALMLNNSRARISRIRLHIFSNQATSQRFKEQVLNPIGGIAIEQHVWDLQRLRAIYESDREREAIELRIADFGRPGIECMQAASSSSIESFLCIIEADLLADLFERYGSRLLEGNVRSFLGMKGGVNKGIRRTIQDVPELFFAFNNGIAATASAVKISAQEGRSSITDLVDLQIVNGGQTTASILNARKKDRLSLAGIKVAMKLTVVEATGANELIPRIAEYANTQNKIAVADFFANHPFHRKIEEISRRLIAPSTTTSRTRSKWFYERARGQYQNERLYLSETKKKAFDLEYPSSQVINKTDLAKYDGVLSEKPHWISLGAQKNFVRFASHFEPPKNSDLTPSEYWTDISPKFNEAYFQRIVAIAMLWRHAETLVSSARDDWYRGDYRAQIVAYGLAMLVHGARKSGYEPNWDLLWTSQAIPSGLSGALSDAAKRAQLVILKLPPGMTNAGEWAKKDSCWENAKVSSPSFNEAPSWLVSRDEERLLRASAQKQGKQDDSISLQQQLLTQASNGYWLALSRWPPLRNFANDAQRALVSRASTPQGFVRIVSERDWRRLAEIQQTCEGEGFRFDRPLA